MTGLFETMLAIHGQVVQLEEHFARLAHSAHELRLPAPDPDAFRAAIAQAVQSDEEMAVRCVYTNGEFTATAGSIPPVTLRRRDDARVVTLDRTIVRDRPEHKLSSYITSRPEIPPGADEALFVDQRGDILEGTTTNIFAITGDTLITAPITAGILPGIVRAWVLANAARVGLDVIERKPTIDVLRHGSFLTSSLTPLAPIVQLDGVACLPSGSAFAELRRLYARMWE
jgi:branched-subunit amino acid aminotransferase/4-amino-4-deoxychorismate lyase